VMIDPISITSSESHDKDRLTRDLIAVNVR
jgi:hypothetical protein